VSNGLDQKTLEVLMGEGINSRRLVRSKPKNMPSNTAGIPGLLVKEVDELRNNNTTGFVVDSGPDGNNARLADAMFVAPGSDPSTIAHEAEHLMARRQLGSGVSINSKFDELFGGGSPAGRRQFVNNAVALAPYLEKKYGMQSAYFSPKMVELQGYRRAPNLLYEQLATLASIEQTQGVDLTKDPELRKTLFKDPKVREIYNAITGLRQTRLDPRDLAPYTPVKEPKPSMTDRLKQMIGYAEGGYVDHAGNRKLI
jgi:hypothetical protein